MSASASSQSSDNHQNTDSNSINTTPDPNKQNENPDENTYGYFIPLVMGIVLGVIIVATFYSKEFNNLITGVASTDQADEISSDANGKLAASSTSTDTSADTADSSVISEVAAVAKASNEVTTRIIEPAGDGSTSTTTPGTSSAVAIAGNNVNPQPYIVASQEYQAPFSTRQDNYAPYAPPMPYGIPERLQQEHSNIMEERRRTYEEATQARREYMIKMHEYRAAVQKRIEQDRQDMYKHRHETRQQKQRKQDELMDSIEQTEKRSMNRPI